MVVIKLTGLLNVMNGLISAASTSIWIFTSEVQFHLLDIWTALSVNGKQIHAYKIIIKKVNSCYYVSLRGKA